MRELGEPVGESRGARARQRMHCLGPSARLRIVPFRQLGVELQEPGETVRALEGHASFAFQVAHLGGNVVWRQARGERGARRAANGSCG